MRKQVTATILFTTLTIFVFAQNTVQDYVNRFGSVAVIEMQRTGIPASVILAQGILTSSFGNSQLALQANNHFNLHCDDAWDGELFYKWERGEKVKRPSCFRVYSKPEESFLEFTNVVANHNEIASLVSYEEVNYKRWIKKLVEIGFSKKSEDQMLRVIEQFTLVEFDEIQHTEITHKSTKREVYSINGLKAVVAKSNDTPLNIASELEMPYHKILKYNDLEEGEVFVENQYIFIEAKRKRSKINEEFHVLRTGETLYDIAQLYGIRLKSLCKLNHVQYDDKVASGERVYLVESAPVRPRIQGERPPARPKEAMVAPAKPKMVAPAKPKMAAPAKPETEALAKPEIIVTEPIAKAEEVKEKPAERRIPPKKPTKAEKEEEVLSYINKPKIEKTNYVIPAPGKADVEVIVNSQVQMENQAAQPIMESPSKPKKPRKSKFDTGTKQKETIAEILKPNENKPKKLPHSNAFGSEEEAIINQGPAKPDFSDLMNPGLSDTDETFEDSAPFPQFDMNDEVKEEEKILPVKRDGYHIVLKGETLYRISVNYGVTVGQIRKWNKLADNTILLGQELKISL